MKIASVCSGLIDAGYFLRKREIQILATREEQENRAASRFELREFGRERAVY